MTTKQQPNSSGSSEIQHTNRIYQQALRCTGQAVAFRKSAVRGLWKENPELQAATLAGLLTELETAPSTTIIKQESRVCVMRAQLLGRDAMVKRYDLTGPIEKLKYLIRPSRARRFWAAACTMAELDIPTPEPLGFLEIRFAHIPLRSYVITAFEPDARNARTWIEPEFHKQSAGIRAAVSADLLAALLKLYQHGIYHGDTKTANMLLIHPANNDARAFSWIDLECVQCGISPTRHQIVRNLVQLNGSLGDNVAAEDRYAFLNDLAQTYPWVISRRTVSTIRRWTDERLGRERRGICGS